jgi:hypothetical protein
MIISSFNINLLPDGARQYLFHSICRQATANGFSSRLLSGIIMVFFFFVNPDHFQNKNERTTKIFETIKTIEFQDKWFNAPRHSRMALSEKQQLPDGLVLQKLLVRKTKSCLIIPKYPAHLPFM